MRTVKFIRNTQGLESHVLTKTPEVSHEASVLKHLSLPVKSETIHEAGSWDIFKLLLALRSMIKKPFAGSQIPSSAEESNQPGVITPTASTSEACEPGLFQKIKDFIYNLIYFPDQAGPWIIPATVKGIKLAKYQKIDIIFATGSPWSGLISGYLISKFSGKPLIVDFRDPWINNPFHQSKGKLFDSWNNWLEKKVVNHSSAVSLNTEPLMQEFVERYPDISEDRFFVMPNGFDSMDFPSIAGISPNSPKTELTFTHAGFLYGVRDPAVFLDAMKLANEKLSDSGIQIIFRQIGKIELEYDVFSVYADMIESRNIIIEPPMPYKDCLNELIKSDWLINVQPATKSQVPSKLYDYLALNKPIMNITPRDGALGQLIVDYKIGELYDFEDREVLTDRLVSIAKDMQQNRFSFEGYSSRNRFDCAFIAKDLEKRITEILAS
jgi:hypothetical protein